MKSSFKRKPLKQYRYLTFLSMLFITVFIICDTTVYRMVDVFGKELPLSGFVIPIVFMIGDIIAETYGYRITMKVVLNGILCQCLFGILISLFLLAPSPVGNILNQEYASTFQNILRANFCSCFSVSSGMFVNAFLISKLKIYMNGKRFWIRTIISSGISEIVLCTVAYLILFTGMRTFAEVVEIIYSVWIYKMMFSILASPVASIIGKVLKAAENSDVYDIGISYNPFNKQNDYVIAFEEDRRSKESITGYINNSLITDLTKKISVASNTKRLLFQPKKASNDIIVQKC